MQGPYTSNHLDREAMKADAAAALSWLRTNERWMLLDQVVTLLLGRSLLRIAFDLCSAVVDLPDRELEALVVLLNERSMAYMAEDAYPLDDAERAALAAFRAAVGRVWDGV